jgi:cell wall-associated NlpC family hydrolase
VGFVHVTEGRRRIARAIKSRAITSAGFRRWLPVGVAAFAGAGMLAGVLTAASSAGPAGVSGATASGAHARAGKASAASPFGLPRVQPSTGAVLPGSLLTYAAVTVAAASPSVKQPSVAPLRRTLQADLLVVSSSSLPEALLASVSRLSGVVAADKVEAVRMKVNGSYTAVLGVDPSDFRSFAARPTAESNALWEGVAGGGVAVSYTMGKLDKLPLGGTVSVAGRTTEKLKVAAFGTLGIGGVNAVVSDAVARSLGAPEGNAIVISTEASDFTAVAAAVGRLVPHGAGVEQLVSVKTTGGSAATVTTSSGAAGAGSSGEAEVPAPQLQGFLNAAKSRLGMPYVWGGDGPDVFDCSGLVQWSFRQAGIVMPRVAADQALTGPSVPVSQLEPGDLLFYHTDPTDPTYISHVAIYIGNGWMLQAPEPGEDVQVVPADFGSEFAGAVRVNPAQAAAVAAQVA